MAEAYTCPWCFYFARSTFSSRWVSKAIESANRGTLSDDCVRDRCSNCINYARRWCRICFFLRTKEIANGLDVGDINIEHCHRRSSARSWPRCMRGVRPVSSKGARNLGRTKLICFDICYAIHPIGLMLGRTYRIDLSVCPGRS